LAEAVAEVLPTRVVAVVTRLAEVELADSLQALEAQVLQILAVVAAAQLVPRLVSVAVLAVQATHELPIGHKEKLCYI
jgi:hypothetical protein